MRIIRERGADADDDRVDERAQPMQMRETGGPVDVMRTAGRRRDAPVERLADLADDDEVIHRAAAKGPEYRLPWRRKARQRAKRMRRPSPGFA